MVLGEELAGQGPLGRHVAMHQVASARQRLLGRQDWQLPLLQADDDLVPDAETQEAAVGRRDDQPATFADTCPDFMCVTSSQSRHKSYVSITAKARGPEGQRW